MTPGRCLRLAVAVALVLGACSEPDAVTQLCNRAQDCNALPSGSSVQDCIDQENRCVGQLTSSEASDWDRMVGDCLENDSCSLFGSCYENVPWC